MKYKAEIDIMPLQGLFDPQGKTVAHSMRKLNVSGVTDIRIGKHISMVLEADSEEQASEKVDTACQQLLANKIMETYTFTIESL